MRLWKRSSWRRSSAGSASRESGGSNPGSSGDAGSVFGDPFAVKVSPFPTIPRDDYQIFSCYECYILVRFDEFCRNAEIGLRRSGGRGASRPREDRGEGAVQHPRGPRNPRTISCLLPSKRPRSAGADHPLHAAGPRRGIRLSGAAVVGAEDGNPLIADDPTPVSKRCASIATSYGDIASGATVRNSRHPWRLAMSRLSLTNGSQARRSTYRASCSRPTRTISIPSWAAA